MLSFCFRSEDGLIRFEAGDIQVDEDNEEEDHHKRTRREVKTWLQQVEEAQKSGNREGKTTRLRVLVKHWSSTFSK